MNENYESPAQLKEDRDYWKNRFADYRKDVEFFVLITLLGLLIICTELIIKNYIEVPIGK